MKFKEILTLKPVLTTKFGGLLAKFATIIWYIVLVLAAVGLIGLLGRIIALDISGFIVGLVYWFVSVVLARIACEALASLKD